MKKHNPNNVRINRKYCIFLKEAKRQDESSIDGVAKAINRFEQYTKFKDFKLFHHQQAVGFKTHLTNQKNETTNKQYRCRKKRRVEVISLLNRIFISNPSHR